MIVLLRRYSSRGVNHGVGNEPTSIELRIKPIIQSDTSELRLNVNNVVYADVWCSAALY